MKVRAKIKSRPNDTSKEISRLVAELDRLKQEQRELEEKYHNTIEYANDAILTVDSRGRISSFNRKAEQMFGYSREETVGKPASMLLPSRRRKKEKDKFKTMSLNYNIAHTGSIREGLGLRKDGQTFPIEGSFHLIKPKGTYAVTGIVRDVSDRKQMEEQLRESEERARVILNASPDMAMLVDNKGTPLDCNEALCLYMTMGKEELFDKTPRDLFDESSVKKRTRIFKKMIRDGKPVRYQDMNQERWFDYSLYPIFDRNGKVIQAVIFAHDTTEGKKNEEEIIAARDKLKALAMEATTIEENARRTFSNYLHDRIGQTLFVLKIRLEMMAKSAAGDESAETWKEIFKLMEKAVNDTRALSYEMSPSILNELGLEAALEWLVDQANKEHDLKVNFQSDRKPKVMDRNMSTVLYRAARELLTNVVKHANAKNVIVSLSQDDHQVWLEMKDDGVGFDTRSLQLLPDRNKGFGLFSIKERLQWHKGDMVVRSAPGKGTHITLLAPLS